MFQNQNSACEADDRTDLGCERTVPGTPGNLSRIPDLVAADYLDHQGLGDKELIGPKGFARVVQAARVDYAELRVSVEDVITAEDRVVVRLRWRGLRALDPSGHLRQEAERETIEILRFANGKAVEHWGTRTA